MSAVLLLDIGNSRLKWLSLAALADPLPPAQAIAHGGEPAAALATLAATLRQPLQAVYIAQVLGAAQEATLAAAVQQLWACTPQFARSSAQCGGLRSAYAEASRLGVDRWLLLLAGWARGQGAFKVASAGTALTFDAVDASGQHQGGVIAPGLAGMIDTTLGRTRFAVGDMAADFGAGLGQDTEACVRQGALHAAAGLLDRLAARHPGPGLLAGGDARTLAPHLQDRWQLEPDLVLQGLAAWARLASKD